MDKLLESIKVMHEDSKDDKRRILKDEADKVLQKVIELDSNQVGSQLDFDGSEVSFDFTDTGMGSGIDYLMDYDNFDKLFKSLGWNTDKVGWHYFANKSVGNYGLEAESKDGKLYIVIK